MKTTLQLLFFLCLGFGNIYAQSDTLYYTKKFELLDPQKTSGYFRVFTYDDKQSCFQYEEYRSNLKLVIGYTKSKTKFKPIIEQTNYFDYSFRRKNPDIRLYSKLKFNGDNQGFYTKYRKDGTKEYTSEWANGKKNGKVKSI